MWEMFLARSRGLTGLSGASMFLECRRSMTALTPTVCGTSMEGFDVRLGRSLRQWSSFEVYSSTIV